MQFKDRLYWFSRNLMAFVLVILLAPIYFTWYMVSSIAGDIMTLTVTDGSEVIGWPHEWDWKYLGS